MSRYRSAVPFCRAILLAGALVVVAQPAPESPAKVLFQEVRSASLDPDQIYRVRDLDILREDLHLYLTDGYLIFSKPIHGERLSAVFSADVEGGDGEVLLLPPFRGERQSLARFTQSPNLDEHFRVAVLVASDGSVEALLDRIARTPTARKTPELGPLLAEQWSSQVAAIQSKFDLRLVRDLLTPPAARSGLLYAALAGKHLGDFDVFYDRSSPNQIAVGHQNGAEKNYAYDLWTNFASRASRNATDKNPDKATSQEPFQEARFQIDASLDADLHLAATVHAFIRIGPAPLRTLTFEVARAIKIGSVLVDGKPAELLKDQDPVAGAAAGMAAANSQNGSFLIVPSTELAANTMHEVEFQEQGLVITSSGNDVYFVAARANWYPRGSGDGARGLALYDMTFRYPNRLTLVTSGEVSEDRVEGDFRVTRHVTSSPIRLAGFNIGDYVRSDYVRPAPTRPESVRTGTASGIRIEVFGNRRLEAALENRVAVSQETTPQDTTAIPIGRGRFARAPAAPEQPVFWPPPNPLARLQAVAADIASALQFFSGLFGPPPLKTLTVSPIPGAFGQGFPGLVYLSTLSYLDPNQRPASARGPREQVFYSDLIEAHEVAHQWWGDVVIPASYQDEWLEEGLANYSALLYLEKKRGVKAMEDVLEDYRDALILKDSKGEVPESAGPITWGFRLESAGNPAAWQNITYYKSAWILHMLRHRMGDDHFLKMLAELRRRYDSRVVTTEQFLALVKEFAPPRAAGVKAFNVEAFFDNWVYSTGIPALKLEYTAKGGAPNVKISGTIGQSEVDDDFSMEAPVEIQFAKGPSQTIWVQTSNDGASFSATLKEMPVKVSIPAGRGVLAVKR